MAEDFKVFLDTLIEKLNIVDVVGNYISLDRRGTDFWACCPFHHEKTPSFVVHQTNQYYHCFGCGESGGVIKFVQEVENIDFMDAVKLLAEQVNLSLPQQTGYDHQKTVEAKRKKDAILKILNETAHFYLNNLNSGEAKEHIDYILKRQIPSPIVRKFGLGASLNFNDLPAYLLNKGYQRQDVIDSGVVNAANGRLSDAQGGRLIYPIINAMNEVVAFGGRALHKVDFGKYKNTRETPVFSKSKTLYNINLLKKLKREQQIKQVIVVEGYMDVISLYSAGFKNVVASMGTSLTQEQARIIKRYTDNVLISYDGDAAGQNANMRGLEILKSEGLNVRVVPLPDGLDPDDVIKQLGPEGYQACLDKAMPLIDFKLQTLLNNSDLSRADSKRKFVADALEIIRTAESSAEQEDLLKWLRDKAGISYESLKRDLSSAPVEKPVEKEPKKRQDLSSVGDKASRFIIASFLFDAEYSKYVSVKDVNFINDVHKLIANYIIGRKSNNEKVQLVEVFELFEENTPEYAELLCIIELDDGVSLEGEIAARYFIDCIKTLRLADVDRRIEIVGAKMAETGDLTVRNTLGSLLNSLISEKNKIKKS